MSAPVAPARRTKAAWLTARETAVAIGYRGKRLDAFFAYWPTQPVLVEAHRFDRGQHFFIDVVVERYVAEGPRPAMTTKAAS